MKEEAHWQASLAYLVSFKTLFKSKVDDVQRMISQLQITPHLESCLVLPPPLVGAVPVAVLFIVLVAIVVAVLVHLFLVVIVLLSPLLPPTE